MRFPCPPRLLWCLASAMRAIRSAIFVLAPSAKAAPRAGGGLEATEQQQVSFPQQWLSGSLSGGSFHPVLVNLNSKSWHRSLTPVLFIFKIVAAESSEEELELSGVQKDHEIVHTACIRLLLTRNGCSYEESIAHTRESHSRRSVAKNLILSAIR